MADEFKTRFTIDLGDGLADLRRLSDAELQVANSTEIMGQKAKEATGLSADLAKFLDMAKTGAVNFATSLAGAFGLNALISEYQDQLRAANEQLKEHARLANEAAEAMVDLQFLRQGGNFKDLAVVKQGATLTGESQVEVAAAYADFRSKTTNLSDEQQAAWFGQLLETKLTTSSSSGTLVPLFSKMSQFVSDPERAQTLIRKTQELSPSSTPQSLAAALPQALIAGRELGLIPEQSAGLLVSAMEVSEETGPNALKNVMTILGGAATPEQKEILEANNADSSLGLVEQLNRLRDAKLSTEDKAKLVGRENFTVFSGMLANDSFGRNIEQVYKASQQGDLTAQAIRNIYTEDKRLSMSLQQRQERQKTEIIKSEDPIAMKAATGRAIIERLLAEAQARGELSPSDVIDKLEIYDKNIATGASPAEAASWAEMGGSMQKRARALFRSPRDMQTEGKRIGPELSDDVLAALQQGPQLTPGQMGGGRSFRELLNGVGEDARNAVQYITTIINNSVIAQDGVPAQSLSPAQVQD